MDPKLGADFIPDQPAKGAPKAPRRISTSGGPDFLVVLAVLVLIVNIALAVGVTMYKGIQESNLEAAKQQLEQEKQSIKYDSIRILSRLDKRLKAANQLVEKHIAPSLLFKMLEEHTLETVYFKKMDYSMQERGKITVKLDGVAESVNSIALQADVFAKNRAIINPVFSNLNMAEDGVEFKLSMDIDKAALLYSLLVNQTPALDVNQ